MPEPSYAESLNTPMMRQYLEIKSRFTDAILFFRMGDFYEMFLEDAIEASKILDITLTKRQNEIPMAGIPYHSTESYISRLLQAGKKIVICEQSKSDDPKSKLMQREVVRIITPGTVVEENLLGGFQNNFLAILCFTRNEIYLGLGDVSTGDLFLFQTERSASEEIKTQISKFSPKEILISEKDANELTHLQLDKSILVTKLKVDSESSSPHPPTKEKYDVVHHLLSAYLQHNYRENQFHFKTGIDLHPDEYLYLDATTVQNLELVDNPNAKSHTLFSVLNKCTTSVGKRVLRNRILFPSRNAREIQSRWEKIESLSGSKQIIHRAKERLQTTIDIERVLSRFRAGKALPRDFYQISKTIEVVSELSVLLAEIGYDFPKPDKELLDYQSEILSKIHDGELPATLGGGIFLKKDWNAELQQSWSAKTQGKDWILQLEEKEKKSTGLSTLKIRYNKILGYYIELSRNQSKEVPSHWMKKQTLVTQERFTSSELEEIERSILQADSIIEEIEKREFDAMLNRSLELEKELIQISSQLGELDFFLALTQCQLQYGWKKPSLQTKGEIHLRNSRHPVVEAFLPLGEQFVPNSIHLNSNEESIALLTGPNMAGKSTFMRQIALNQILFQMGSFLPSDESELPIVDRIFTRIGSGDNLTQGESTFFVEMKETAEILKNLTKDSLILFDEVGRGTSTYDGLSLAWAILEYLSSLKPRPKTIFSTHYHELTDLEKGNGIFNLYMETLEREGSVLFLRKVKKGKVKKSFGAYVAKLAGIPPEIVNRALEILESLESKKKEIRIRREEPLLFPEFTKDISKKERDSWEKCKRKIQKTKLEETTPLQALQLLEELQTILKNEI